jgi:phosphoglycolate phosphatase
MSLTVVFDLDGTLVDTAPDLADTLNLVLEREGVPPVPYPAARTMIGAGARRMIERGLTAAGRALNAAQVDRMLADFIDHYSAHIAVRSRPFPGVEHAMDKLAASGCRFAVCTNKYEQLTRLLLDTLGLSQRFAAVAGQDTFGIRKPDPDVLRRTIRMAGGDVARAVMVGDSAIDIETARGADVPVVVVSFGYTEIPVAELRPDRLIEHFQELPAAVLDLARSRALAATGPAAG